MKLTFKQYLESKERLRIAIEETPKQSITYRVSKYCKLMVGETKEEKEFIKLKPNQTIIIEWFYDEIDNPTILNVQFNGVSEAIDNTPYGMYWRSTKIRNWLATNTIDG